MRSIPQKPVDAIAMSAKSPVATIPIHDPTGILCHGRLRGGWGDWAGTALLRVEICVSLFALVGSTNPLFTGCAAADPVFPRPDRT
jgi:hypothetical protein